MMRYPWRDIFSWRRVLAAILWLVWLAAAVTMAGNAQQMKQVYRGISLRYTQPVSQKAAFASRMYASQTKTNTFWPSFWAEEQRRLVTDIRQADALCLWFWGDATLVYPAQFINGQYPSAADNSGISLSTGLAWQLWGQFDAVGHTLNIDGRQYTVRGVFQEEKPIALINTGEDGYAAGWQGVALLNQQEGDARTAAIDFSKLSGLGEPSQVVVGSVFFALMVFLALAPTAILLAIGIVKGIIWLLHHTPLRKEHLFFGLLILLAATSPFLLDRLPPAIIPSRWSDFSFWQRLFDQWKENVTQYLMMTPAHVDLLAKQLVIWQGMLFSLSLIALACLPGVFAGLQPLTSFVHITPSQGKVIFPGSTAPALPATEETPEPLALPASSNAAGGHSPERHIWVKSNHHAPPDAGQ